MNTEVMFSSKSDMWSTPQAFYDKLNQEFNFTCDVCSIAEDAKHKNFYTPEIDGLAQEWSGVCWCNPPYSDISSWTRKAVTEAYRGVTTVMLIPSGTDTKYFHGDILRYSVLNPDSEQYSIETELRFVPGRLKFGNSKNSAPFPSLVIIFRRKEIDKKLNGVLTDWEISGGFIHGYCKSHEKLKEGSEIRSKIVVNKSEKGYVETETTKWVLV